MRESHDQPAHSVKAGAVVSKAALRAAEQLGVSAKSLAATIGVSEATVSRMRRDEFELQPGTKPFELAVLFVRMFRSLDAIGGGEERVAQRWLVAQNEALGGVPAELMLTVAGLVNVISYLDARRALV